MKRKVAEQYFDIYFGLLIFIFALLVRIVYVLYLEAPHPIRGDAASYVQYAKNLMDYGIFSRSSDSPPVPDAYWAPLYPVFLVGSIKLSSLIGSNFYLTVLYLQAFIGSMVAVLTYFVGRIFLSKIYAAIAAIFVILSPHLISHGGCLITETLFSFVLLLAVYSYLRAVKMGNYLIPYALSGSLFGLAYLANPVSVVVPFCLVVFHVHRHFKLKIQSIKLALIFLSTLMAFVFSWQLREHLNVPSGQEVSSDRAFVTLVIGAHSDYHDLWRDNPRNPDNPADIDFAKYKNDHLGFYRVFFERFVAHPFQYMKWYCFGKPKELWGWDVLVGFGDVFVYPVYSTMFDSTTFGLIQWIVMKHLHYWLIGLAILGLFFVIREPDRNRRNSILAMYLTLISVSAVYILFQTDGRYSVPLRPEMYLCVAYSLSRLMMFYNNYRQNRISK